jgi:hypothetical protein
LGQCDHVSGVFRLRNNRKLYRRPPPYAGRGHPTWHGPLFRLNDPTTWGDPDESAPLTETDERGRTWTIHLRRWDNLHFREARQDRRLPILEWLPIGSGLETMGSPKKKPPGFE